MKLLVCISSTPDTTAKISFKDDNSTFNKEGVSYIMNPYDEWYALVRALELKEAEGGTVTVVLVGTAEHDTIIRKALAIGADDAIRIDKEPYNAMDVARQIAAIANNESYDLIFTGKETIDYNASEMGAMLAELLDMHFIAYANDLQIADGQATISREIEGGDEIISLSLPFVCSASKGLAEQRIPNMRGIMMAKRKPLQVVEPVTFNPRINIVRFDKPTERISCEYIDASDMELLVKKLHEEAKVI